MRRRPAQNLFAMALVLVGVWLCVGLWHWQQERLHQRLPGELPDIEIVDASPEELYRRGDFEPRAEDPRSWRQISLRLYAEAGGIYLKFLRCRIDADEVAPHYRQLLAHPARRRSPDDLPPAWWPRPPAGDPWRVPEWWQPSGVGVHFDEPLPDGSCRGAYLAYQPDGEWLHYWEWRRHGVERPRSAAGAVAETLAGLLARQLIAEGHPADADGWLHAPGASPAVLGEAASTLPGLRRVDALLLPRAGRVRFLLALHGLHRERAEALLADQPMRPLADGSPPPAEAWSFALPGRGNAALPNWFAPGAGPRWGYSLLAPGLELADAGRWAAYDEDAAALYVWDWFGPPGQAGADLFTSDR